MTNDNKPLNNSCGTELTIKHIFTERRQYSNDLNTYNIPSTPDAALGPNPKINKRIFSLKKNQICTITL